MDTLMMDFALGALPELDLCESQKWQCISSFCHLDCMDLEMADSGAAGSTWVGCDLLQEGEEYSSKLLCHSFSGLDQPASTTISDLKGLCATASPFAAAAQAAPTQGTSPATSVGTLGAQQDSYAVLSPPASPASSPAASEPLALSQAGSRAGTPEPLANLADAEAVCMVGLALQLAQGDANGAMAHLLTWAATQ